MTLIAEDPELHSRIRVLTPVQSLVGIAGYFAGPLDASKTFLGVGIIPSDRNRLRAWDPYHTGSAHPPDARMADSDLSRGLVGVGMARILGLCGPLQLANCPSIPLPQPQVGDPQSAPNADLVALATKEVSQPDADAKAPPQIQLLAATAGGAPNVVGLTVAGVEPQGVRELDENYVVMDLPLAQQLVYGRGEHRVNGIMVQLHRTEDMPLARARLTSLFQTHHLKLEIRDFGALNPFYGQVIRLFTGIFLFVALVMGLIVLFAVVNTMTMNVMERVNEIGTTRALGARRAGIRSQFLLEGLLIGALGAALGILLALAIALLVNHAGLTWTPPGNANPVPLRMDVLGHPGLIVSTGFGLVAVAAVAALIPANLAAKLSVVDALRHV
jgi:putative ABC transport system permease protein